VARYFCESDDLRAALASSPIDGERAVRAIARLINAGLAEWVEHWSLWVTLERLKDRMSEAAYPNAFHQGIKAPPAKDIKAKLKEWEAMIDVDILLRDFRLLKKESLKRPRREQLHSCIYAKNVFPQIVVVELNKLKTEIDSNEWMPKLAEWLPDVPADIAAVLQPLVV
jgi:hypothetical protein